MESSLPAKSDVIRLRLYTVVSASLLLLPVVLSLVALPSRQQVYMGLPAVRGDGGSIESTIFDNQDDSDAILVGSSTMCTALRPVVVNRYFTQKLGREAKIRYLYLLRSKPDVHYLEIRDYLQTHHTKLIVLAMPERFQAQNSPDESICDILRFGEVPELYEGMSLGHKAAIYGEMVLNGPRQFLNAIRPNVLSKHEKTTDGLDEDVVHRYGKIDPLSITFEDSAERYLFSPGSDRLNFDSTSAGKSGYFGLMFSKILKLAKDHGAKVLLVNLPMSRDLDSDPIRVNLPKEVLDPGQSIVATSKADLFGQISGKEAEKKYFQDPLHLNAEGAAIYSAKVIPALYSVFAGTNRPGAQK